MIARLGMLALVFLVACGPPGPTCAERGGHVVKECGAVASIICDGFGCQSVPLWQCSYTCKPGPAPR